MASTHSEESRFFKRLNWKEINAGIIKHVIYATVWSVIAFATLLLWNATQERIQNMIQEMEQAQQALAELAIP